MVYVFHLIYIIIICLGLSFFYVQILTPKKSISHPQRTCFLLSLVLTWETVFVFLNSSVLSSIWFLSTLALPAFLLFQEKIITKIVAVMLLLLSCSFAELSSMTLMSAINLFMSEMDLIPAHILLSGKILPSFLIYAINTFVYLLFLSLFSKASKKILIYLRPKISILLAFPFFIVILNCGILASIKNHITLFICTPILTGLLICATLLLLKALKELQHLEQKLLQAKYQKHQIKHHLKYYENIEKAFNIYRKWKHDLSNHLSIISILLEQKNYKETEKYLTSYIIKEFHKEDTAC